MSGDVLVLLPNTAALVSEFLRDQTEIAQFVEQRVYTKVPASKVFPLVRITRIGARTRSTRPRWVETVWLQIDCFGGPARVAHDLAETCRAVLVSRLPGVQEIDGTAGVVTDVAVGGITETDDTTEPKARPVARFDVWVTVHPQPLSGS